MFKKPIIPKRKNKENLPTPEEVSREVQAKFSADIRQLAEVLEWKETTVCGLIIDAYNQDNFYWRGITPYEIAAQQLYWQTNFGYLSRKQRRETFLSNL